MIQDFSQREDFTIEIETTPACNLDCPWCENRRKETSGSLAGQNVDFGQLLVYAGFVKQNLPRRKQIRIVLNGGEPTLHPGLLDFCRRASDVGYHVELLTNLTARVELYREAMSSGCAVVPTFHLGYSEPDFADKLARLQLCQVRAFAASAEQLTAARSALPGILAEAVVPEGSQIFQEAASRLASASASARQQLELKLKLESRAKKPRICWSCSKYLYVNQDGSVQPCMFLPRSYQTCRISDVDSYRLPQPTPCCNPWCFYFFGEEK